ncbi:MAG TPA: DUF4962 domain-containing protein, partial [Pyrinomonadaceae bacterium]|nr:DUF4962 domain-containing protein [Pyrinomonadaceae bacterium]
QSERESSKSTKMRGPHPITELMTNRNSTLRPELRGQHPRVYVTESELQSLRKRAHTTHRELWQLALQNIRALSVAPPPPPAEERRAQNEVGIGIAESAFAYKIEGDKKYLEAAKRYMDAAVSYNIWGYSFNRPNTDLAAGHLLYGMGVGYDLLYHDLTETERARYREKIIRQARLMFDYFKPKEGKTYSYSQNHTFIPISGLAVAAYALYDEVKDAPEWAALARAIFDRVLATYSADGYYYEGFEYWIFSTPWLIHYMDAHAHATGEDLYDRPGFQLMYKYVAHAMLPGGDNVFDFGDVYAGPETRAHKGEDYERTHPYGHYSTNYNILYRLASRFRNGEAQGVAAWLKGLGQVNAEEFWSLLWYDPTVKAISIEKQERWHYFPDHEVVYWRSSWGKDATAFAFKCGPPEGHHAAELLLKFPDWRLSSGHAHPDANSFIIYSRGKYLTGDSGYAGVPLTAHHNTVLIDGRGQGLEGKGHDAFDGVPYDQLDKIRIVEAKLARDSVELRGDATNAYQPELGVVRFIRWFRFDMKNGFTVSDDVQTTKPRTFTALLHSDDRMTQISANQFEIDAADTKLKINVNAPAQARAAIEPNDLTAPGPPGSVDKGEKQVRGLRLAVTTTHPATSARFVMTLKVEGRSEIRNSPVRDYFVSALSPLPRGGACFTYLSNQLIIS